MPVLNQTCVEVSLEALRCEAIIGIYPYERRQTQPLTLDLTLSLDAARYWRWSSMTSRRTKPFKMRWGTSTRMCAELGGC